MSKRCASSSDHTLLMDKMNKFLCTGSEELQQWMDGQTNSNILSRLERNNDFYYTLDTSTISLYYKLGMCIKVCNIKGFWCLWSSLVWKGWGSGVLPDIVFSRSNSILLLRVWPNIRYVGIRPYSLHPNIKTIIRIFVGCLLAFIFDLQIKIFKQTSRNYQIFNKIPSSVNTDAILLTSTSFKCNWKRWLCLFFWQ